MWDEKVHANPEVSRGAFDLLNGDKEWFEIEGDHFGLGITRAAPFDEATSVQADFLTRNLLL
jgi:hypothetical protein